MFERNSNAGAYFRGALVVVICTLVARIMYGLFAEANLVMVYLLGIVIVAARVGRGPSILASVLSVAAFDFFFVHPFQTFAVSDVEYAVTFAIMLVVALVISTLTYRLRLQAEEAEQRERRAAALSALIRDLASTQGRENLLATAVRHMRDASGGRVGVLLPDKDNRLRLAVDGAGTTPFDHDSLFAAQRLYEGSRLDLQDAPAHPDPHTFFIPLVASSGPVGVLVVDFSSPRERLQPEQRLLLETFAAQTALALERAYLSEEAERTRVQIHSEQLRNALLSSVSHDLRTPLAAITGAASTLLEEDVSIDPPTRVEMAQSIYDEAYRLNRLVSNLLDMTRLESGGVQVRKEWYSLEELVGAALSRLERGLQYHLVTVRLDDDLPLVPLDDVLIEQALINVLENAAKYTAPGSPILLTVSRDGGCVIVSVADKGPGLAPGEETRIFDKFFRGTRATAGGAGLGLAISRAIVEAHGGRIWAENAPTGGTIFRLALPLGEPPRVVEETLEPEKRISYG